MRTTNAQAAANEVESQLQILYMIPEVFARDALTVRLRDSRCVHDAEHGGDGVGIGVVQTDVNARFIQQIVHHGLWRMWITDERPSRGGDVFWERCTRLEAQIGE